MRKGSPAGFAAQMSETDYNDNLSDMVETGKALPDLVRKKHIYEAHKAMADAEFQIVVSKLRNNGRINHNRLITFQACILECWRMFDEMAYESKIKNFHDIRVYDMDDIDLIPLLYSSNKVLSEKMLHHLANYVDYCLHKLNLSNLLIDNVPFDSNAENY